jgi:HD-GYP domain-containing protein (c-di-GMP phosphodiesterase class II)
VASLALLSRALATRDPEARAHSTRVTALAVLVARRLDWTDHELAPLRLGGTLHDVGKLGVPERILRKPGRLTVVETAQIRAHPALGVRLLAAIPDARRALPYVLYHHERWDGGGYPSGRARDEIPLGARVLAVADAFDAMTCDRPYRRALTVGQALAELERCAGSQFDPTVARVFLAAWRESAARVAAVR